MLSLYVREEEAQNFTALKDHTIENLSQLTSWARNASCRWDKDSMY